MGWGERGRKLTNLFGMMNYIKRFVKGRKKNKSNEISDVCRNKCLKGT